MIFLTCSGGISSFCASWYPNFRLSPYRLAFSCCHFLACSCVSAVRGNKRKAAAVPCLPCSGVGCSDVWTSQQTSRPEAYLHPGLSLEFVSMLKCSQQQL